MDDSRDGLDKVVCKVLSSDDEVVFVPEDMADQFIKALQRRAFVRQANQITVDLMQGNLRVPRSSDLALRGRVRIL